MERRKVVPPRAIVLVRKVGRIEGGVCVKVLVAARGRVMMHVISARKDLGVDAHVDTFWRGLCALRAWVESACAATRVTIAFPWRWWPARREHICAFADSAPRGARVLFVDFAKPPPVK